MTEHKFTDEEIIKALEWCIACNARQFANCDGCSLDNCYPNCDDEIEKMSLDLINRQNEKITIQQKIIDDRATEILRHDSFIRDLHKQIETVKAEAVKEVAREVVEIIKQRIEQNEHAKLGIQSKEWLGIYRGRHFAYEDIKEIIEQKYGEAPSPNNTCICCGEIIPEGRQVCPSCEKQLKNYKPKGVKTKTIGKYTSPDLGVQLTIDDMENNND